MVPFQQPGVPETHGLTLVQCEAAAWAITPGPHRMRYRGAGAVNAALAVALGTRLPLSLYQVPVIRQIQDIVYAFVARIRSRLPGDAPYCEQHPERCG